MPSPFACAVSRPTVTKWIETLNTFDTNSHLSIRTVVRWHDFNPRVFIRSRAAAPSTPYTMRCYPGSDVTQRTVIDNGLRPVVFGGVVVNTFFTGAKLITVFFYFGGAGR